MAIDSEPKRWSMHALASGIGRNTVFNPDTSGLSATERVTVLRHYGGISWQTLTPAEGGSGPIFVFEWIWDRYSINR